MATGAMGASRWGDYRPVGPSTADSSGLVAITPAICEQSWGEVSLHVVRVPLDGAARRRARTEATELCTALSGLDGRSGAGRVLVPLFGHCTDTEGRLVLVTDRITATLAGELAQAGPQPVDVVLAAAATAGAGLDLLHGAGLVHRGLAPGALVRDRDGRIVLGCPPLPVLVEFAAATTDGTGHEPPEVLAGADWTPQADVYALASTLWTLLAGTPPEGGGREQRLKRLLGDGPPPCRRTGLPESIEPGLRAGLAPDPAARPQRATELVGLLTEDPEADRERAERQQMATRSQNRPLQSAGSSLRPLGAQYLLVAPIGSGASGTVWRALRRSDSRVLAAKLLHPALAGDHTVRARLVTEQATLLRLSHPHLVPVHDLVAEGNQLAIVMELVEGEDLRSLLRRRALDRATGLRLLAEVAAALGAVHRAGVVHRDVKPENVLVTPGPRGHARLTDFGLAKALDSPTLTRQGQVPGTPAYLAPELLVGRPAGPPADIYALGTMLYELLAGQRPFDESSLDTLRRGHLEEVPARPAGLPGPLWSLVAACLDKSPARRPTAVEVLQAPARLGTEVSDLPSTAAIPPRDAVQLTAAGTRPPAVRPAPPEAPRRRRWPAMAAALATVVLGLAAGLWWAASPDPGPDPAAASPPPASQARYVIPVSAVFVGNDQVTLSWSAGVERLGTVRGYVVLRDGQATGNLLPPGTTSFRDPDPRSGSCYQVVAIGLPGAPPGAPPAACLPVTTPP